MKHLIYLRVSTEEQRRRKKGVDPEEDGLGLQAQLRACQSCVPADCKATVYKDIITGTDKKEEVLVLDDLSKRTALQEALRNLKKGDVFIVSKRERLARDPFVIAMIERIIKKKKASFVSADGSMEDKSPNGMLLRHMIDGFAKYEALLISLRTKAALAERKAKGQRVGHVPYGFKLTPQGLLETCLEEAEVLEVMYKYRVEDNMTFRDIAESLNDEGYRNRKDTLWTHGATSRVYNNHLLINPFV